MTRPAPSWVMRHGGIEWSDERRVAVRGATGHGGIFAWGPDVPTTGRVLVQLRILRSEAADTQSRVPKNSGYSMYAGAALDGRVGPAISVRLWDGAYHLQQVASHQNKDGQMLHKIATSRRGDIVRRVFELAIEEGELYVAWEGEERKKVPLPPGGLPERVRPWIKLCYPNDAIELAGITRRGRPGAALAFALALKRISESEQGPHVPTELASRIWTMSLE